MGPAEPQAAMQSKQATDAAHPTPTRLRRLRRTKLPFPEQLIIKGDTATQGILESTHEVEQSKANCAGASAPHMLFTPQAPKTQASPATAAAELLTPALKRQTPGSRSTAEKVPVRKKATPVHKILASQAHVDTVDTTHFHPAQDVPRRGKKRPEVPDSSELTASEANRTTPISTTHPLIPKWKSLQAVPAKKHRSKAQSPAMFTTRPPLKQLRLSIPFGWARTEESSNSSAQREEVMEDSAAAREEEEHHIPLRSIPVTATETSFSARGLATLDTNVSAQQKQLQSGVSPWRPASLSVHVIARQQRLESAQFETPMNQQDVTEAPLVCGTLDPKEEKKSVLKHKVLEHLDTAVEPDMDVFVTNSAMNAGAERQQHTVATTSNQDEHHQIPTEHVMQPAKSVLLESTIPKALFHPSGLHNTNVKPDAVPSNSDSPLPSLAESEWVERLQSFIDGRRAQRHTVFSNVADRSSNIVISSHDVGPVRQALFNSDLSGLGKHLSRLLGVVLHSGTEIGQLQSERLARAFRGYIITRGGGALQPTTLGSLNRSVPSSPHAKSPLQKDRTTSEPELRAPSKQSIALASVSDIFTPQTSQVPTVKSTTADFADPSPQPVQGSRESQARVIPGQHIPNKICTAQDSTPQSTIDNSSSSSSSRNTASSMGLKDSQQQIGNMASPSEPRSPPPKEMSSNDIAVTSHPAASEVAFASDAAKDHKPMASMAPPELTVPEVESITLQLFHLVSRKAPQWNSHDNCSRMVSMPTWPLLRTPSKLTRQVGSSVRICTCSTKPSQLLQSVQHEHMAKPTHKCSRRLCGLDTEQHEEYHLLHAMVKRFKIECASRRHSTVMASACKHQNATSFILGSQGRVLGYISLVKSSVHSVQYNVRETSEEHKLILGRLPPTLPAVVDLYVEPEFRGKRVASGALQAALRGHGAVIVDDPSKPALQVLQRAGFIVAGICSVPRGRCRTVFLRACAQ